MHPDKVIREKVTKLTDLPNIGKASAADLVVLGIEKPADLLGQAPYDMYYRLCDITGQRHDPCVIDVFISITRFINGDDPKPWWHYTAERKRAHSAQ
ncbi:helix-hairpin-helix domain-containing protein [Rheinheimera aquimaris]|uniref:helix-hairpin-helix domain-containing protein n=1 Tax=Rheinheimera aquimaris TaxID=412437 RepID=UPI003A975932